MWRRAPGAHGLLVAALLLAAHPGMTAQLGGGGVSGSGAAKQIERGVRHPLPPLPPAPAPPRPGSVWVPDRYLGAPEGGALHVPGHWEQRRADGQYDVPPLTVCDSAGRCATLPAAVKPPVEQRVEP